MSVRVAVDTIKRIQLFDHASKREKLVTTSGVDTLWVRFSWLGVKGHHHASSTPTDCH